MVIFVCRAGNGFPNGTAPTSRVANYAAGLLDQGEKVFVLCVDAAEDPRVGVLNTAASGVHDGVPFEYSPGRTTRGESYATRRLLQVLGYVRGASVVTRVLRKEPVRVVFAYPHSLLGGAFFFAVSRLAGAAYVADVSELPFFEVRPGTIAAMWAARYQRFAYKMLDGAVVVSGALERHLGSYMRRGVETLRIPILVDVDRFAGPSDESGPLPDGRYVMYCGLLNEAKDGVASLMRAFALVAAEIPDVTLALVGDSCRDSQIPRYATVADGLGIEGRVVFVGQVSREDLPRYLAQATALALARPASRQAEYGFPTKLGEYLAAGKPVVVTRTGEIAEFLEDGVSAYIVPPGDIEGFAGALRRILTSPEAAREVGHQGQAVARRHFDYRCNGARLRGFLLKTYSRRQVQGGCLRGVCK
jgi:glycosyltransferase involved in cell wall biosynthesis